MSLMVHCILRRGLVINISKYSSGRERGGHRKEYSMYDPVNVYNSGRHLITIGVVEAFFKPLS